MDLSVTQTFYVTAFLISIGVFVLMMSTAFIGYGASQMKQQTNPDTTRVPNYVWGFIAFLAIWFGVGLATSAGGFISFELVLPFMLIPITLGTVLSFTAPIKNILKEIPTHWLIYLQIYRVAGGLFIYPYLTEGLLTRGFALNAGIGDVLTGLFAIPVAYLVLKGGKRYTWLFVAWTVFGILDLIVAPASAAYFGFSAEGVAPRFPITIIPLFFGPPFGILIQIITLRNFWLRYRLNDAGEKMRGFQ